MDAAGVVLDVGEGVKRFRAGDRVYTAGSVSGTYAQEVLCRDDQVYALPKTTSYQEGAALGVPYATAYQALFIKAAAQKGETVLIHGASGGVGIAAVQFAKQEGLKIIATAGSEEGIKLVKNQGAEHVFNHNDSGYFEKLQQLTGEAGIEVILEMLADKNLENDLALTGFRGRIVVIGCRGTIEINPRRMMGKESTVIGMTIMNATDEEKKITHHSILKGLMKEKLRPVIGQEFSLAQASEAHRAVLRPGARGKIVLIP
jgi:NADPH2:quinone reductase